MSYYDKFMCFFMSGNIFSKMNEVKLHFLKSNVKKSGLNKFANFDYFELKDIEPIIQEKCNDVNLYTHITFDKDFGTLTIIDCDKPEDKLVFQSPRRNDFELKGCNALQAEGAIQTYIRRYLLLTAFDICENDFFDAMSGNPQVPQDSKPRQKQQSIGKGEPVDIFVIEEILQKTPSKKGLNAQKIYDKFEAQNWWNVKSNKPITAENIKLYIEKGWL